ncbi:tripartite tricarboxylate transporter TctB family protein [Tardiphaga alba]|uniref:Tripartite tricarboxylate transporter TctB family protein n=1 Tax=Tardiphaga alba TaxID=340268 RepID=A0ABX8A5N7_9BRAD|nr:tripartite tricarboxylate transporter TctB family protein [Tardiphaga alba]QUS39009.1 tripartite tricarboxylate transporter TctB family protein [Tardiphaga alba]
MSDAPSHAPEKSILPSWVKGPQDFIGGLALVAIAAFALWASSDLQGMHGFSFGAGTAPRMFGILLLGLGAAVMCVGIFTEGPALQKFHWRGPFFVMLAILSFAFCIRPMGMIFSAMSSFLIAAMGSTETKWIETAIVGACLTTFCALLFPYALGLPLQMWPTFLMR